MESFISEIKFYVNGEQYSVPNDRTNDSKLIDFLREKAYLTGTKASCREGSCGSCIVSTTTYDPVSQEDKSIAVNSCLLPLYLCNGLRITTTEGLGNSRSGYHAIQDRLTEFNGSLCGYCSPGIVMNMYSLLLDQTSSPSYQTIEDIFDGNMCRCTGYRSILEAMKTFGTPQIKDIEDLDDWILCDNPGNCNTACKSVDQDIQQCNKLCLKDGTWCFPQSMKQLFKILQDAGQAKVTLVFGNTGKAIFKDDSPSTFLISIKGIYDLYEYTVKNDSVTIGANITLNTLIDLLSKQKTNGDGFAYCSTIAEIIKEIANHPIRNVASWAGNLMMKHCHPEFPSDLFTIFEAAGIKLTIANCNGSEKTYSPDEFVKTSMEGCVIKNMILPNLTNQHQFYAFRVAPRNENCPAFVNAAFLLEINSSKNYLIISTPSIVYGGISPDFVHATKTEAILTGRELGSEKTLQMALDCLLKEVLPNSVSTSTEIEYKKQLTFSLFYKMVLNVAKNEIDPKYESGGETIVRPISTGTQDSSSNPAQYPLTKAIPKVESKAQCSGELKYTSDITKPDGTVYGAFVISTIANGTIKSIDATDALAMEGVQRFITAKDIPGENNIIPPSERSFAEAEVLFCTGNIRYAGQPLGLIIADSADCARLAAKKVIVNYASIESPVLTIEQAIDQGRVKEYTSNIKDIGDVKEAMNYVQNKLDGEVTVGAQSHFYLENQVALCLPTYEGVKLHTSTQWVSGCQDSTAQVLGITRSKVNVTSYPLGGAFGGKTNRNLFVTSACSLAAHLMRKPVYIQLDLETNMKMMGKRNPYFAKYEIGFQDDGTLKAVKVDFYVDSGNTENEASVFVENAIATIENVYHCPNWLVTPNVVTTDTPTNCRFRSSGSVHSIFTMEYIMDHIASHLKKDPLEVRTKNLKQLIKHHNSLLQSSNEFYSCCFDFGGLWKQLQDSAEVEKRKNEVAQFNENNRWRKRGLSFVPLQFPINYEMASLRFSATVNIFTSGGSVTVSHSATESGQGINTKIIQVCASLLGISGDLISVTVKDALNNANGSEDDNNLACELNCYAVQLCCTELNKKLAPIKASLTNPSWETLISECYKKGLSLTATSMVGPGNYPQNYSIFGASCSEVEIDVLTGQTQVSRVDLLYDSGQSLNPLIDIIKVEGDFVMGIGLFLTEEVKYNKKTGVNITSSTWNYFPPSSKDIPVDLRVLLLKDAPNPNGVLGSKSCGDAPLILSTSVFLALKQAIASVRQDNDDNDWFDLKAPATPANIFLTCGVSSDSFKLSDKS